MQALASLLLISVWIMFSAEASTPCTLLSCGKSITWIPGCTPYPHPTSVSVTPNLRIISTDGQGTLWNFSMQNQPFEIRHSWLTAVINVITRLFLSLLCSGHLHSAFQSGWFTLQIFSKYKQWHYYHLCVYIWDRWVKHFAVNIFWIALPYILRKADRDKKHRGINEQEVTTRWWIKKSARSRENYGFKCNSLLKLWRIWS